MRGVFTILLGSCFISPQYALARDFQIKKEDIVYPKLALVFDAGETTKVIEKSSFNITMANPLRDRCEIRVREAFSDKRIMGRLKKVQDLRIQIEQPKLEIDRFVGELRAYVPQVFSSMIKHDPVEGVVFRKDDLKMEMNTILNSDPLQQVPRTFRARLEQSLVTHLWGCYGDLMKYRSKASSVVSGKLRELKQMWGDRLVSDVAASLRTQAKSRDVRSDQLAKTKVSLRLGQVNPNAPDPGLEIDCVFEGPASTFSRERLNTALSPHFEVFPRRDFARLRKQNALPFQEAALSSRTTW